MLARLRQYLELIRFSHTLFALPFALLAAAMAWAANARDTPPRPFLAWDALGIVVCMVMARSAAMAFNRLVDRRLDALNPRTQARHLPRGVLGVGSVAVFTLLCALGFVAGTLLFLPQNWIPLAAAAPVLAFLFGYSFAKRFTLLSHWWLGAALALAPLAAWVALRAENFAPPLLLAAAVTLWVAGFDIIYACQDFDFDRQMRLHSVPARLGIARALRLAALCHLGMIAVLAALPLCYPFGRVYLAGVAAVALLLGYEHWLVRPDDLTRVNRAFFHMNAVVSLGLLTVGVADLLL
ncbi:MAG: UbiA-like polyprenyltransferase [Thermoguttaceae bacterium]|jgi:4-hydroxybenzoate polyprenyltransferase